jgi:MFS family permease
MTQWLIVILAAIGFAFDIYELLMAQYIVRPAIQELSGAKPGTDEFARWAGMLFYVPALVGGFFGLIGGYLTDLLGRRRVLTWSILLYAVSAFFAGYSTSMTMLLALRCTTFVGVCVEFVAAVAWLAELFPEPHRREQVLGYTQAFSSAGGLLVSAIYGLILKLMKDGSLPTIAVPEFAQAMIGKIAVGGGLPQDWRWLLMSGLVPAFPLIVIRPFLPESPAWAAKKAAGTLKRPSVLELFAPKYRRVTIVSTLLFACSYGVAFGAIQQFQHIAPGVPEVKAETAGKPVPKQKEIERDATQRAGLVQELGGLVGRFLLAVLAVRVASRRKLLRIFQAPDLLVAPVVFAVCATHSLNWYYVGIFFVGLLTVSQFSFWGNYLPRVYPLHLRGTGEGFAANIGGRMIGTAGSAALVTWLSVQQFMPGADAPAKMAYSAAVVAGLMLLIGSFLCFFLPEPGSGDPAD